MLRRTYVNELPSQTTKAATRRRRPWRPRRLGRRGRLLRARFILKRAPRRRPGGADPGRPCRLGRRRRFLRVLMSRAGTSRLLERCAGLGRGQPAARTEGLGRPEDALDLVVPQVRVDREGEDLARRG